MCAGCHRNSIRCVYPSTPKQAMPKGFELVAEKYDKNVVVKKLIMVSMTKDTPDKRGKLSIVKEDNFEGPRSRISGLETPVSIKTEDLFSLSGSFPSPLTENLNTALEDVLPYHHHPHPPLPVESHAAHPTNISHEAVLSPLMFMDLADIRAAEEIPHTDHHNIVPIPDDKEDHEEVEMLLDEELHNNTSIDGEIYTKRFESMSIPPTDENGSTFASSAVQPYASPNDKSSPLSAFLLDVPLINFSKYLPNITLSPENSELYYHFLNDFMPSISPSHSPPKLTVRAQWAGIADNPLLLEIFLSCGASYMSFNNPNFSSLAENRYRRSLRMLSEVLEKGNEEDENREIYGQLTQTYGNGTQSLSDQDWVFTAVLTLLLRDRAIGASGSQLAKHLIFLNKLLMKRIKKKNAENDFTISPMEKTIFDSSLFNYTNVIMCCSEQDLVQLPDPFSFYGAISKFVAVNIHDENEFQWVSNPVTGSAVEEFEIMGKLIWLLRLHHCISSKALPNYIKNRDFWNMVIPLKSQIILAQNKLKEQIGEWESKPGDKSLRVNLSVSNVILSGCSILLEKIINPTVPAYLEVIQDRVEGIFHDLQNFVTSELHSSCLIHLSLFIAGCASVGEEQRAFLRDYLLQDSKTLNSVATTNILQVLQDSWDRELFEKNLSLHDENYQSFDLLFDRGAIEILCF